MHVALVTHGLPQPSSNGGPMTCWGLQTHLLEAGHEVTVVALRHPGDRFAGPEREEVVRATGAALVSVPVPEPELRPGVMPTPLQQTGALAPTMEGVLRDAGADVAFVYHWDTLAACHGVHVLPKLGAVGDPVHLPRLRRWQNTRPVLGRLFVERGIRVARETGPMTREMVALLGDCDAYGCFQADAAAWLRRKGAGACAYFASPIADPGLPGPRPANARPRILLGPSRIASTSTRAGVELFAREILPALERALGRDGFEVHVVGEGDPPPVLARVLPHPAVVMRGRVEPADDEFAACDVQLVPTPFVLGIRLRLVSGLAHGCCVVAHAAEQANIPELADGENCLLGRSGAELADAIARAARDPELRARIGSAARRTYEEHFHPSVAGAAIARRLEEIAGTGSAAR